MYMVVIKTGNVVETSTANIGFEISRAFNNKSGEQPIPRKLIRL